MVVYSPRRGSHVIRTAQEERQDSGVRASIMSDPQEQQGCSCRWVHCTFEGTATALFGRDYAEPASRAR